jgi:MtN3 and saliva related transmembrane protein
LTAAVSLDVIIGMIGIVAAILTTSSFIPQITKALRTRRMDDVSAYLMMLFICGFSLWVAYGVMRNDPIIIGANTIGVGLNVFLLALKFRFSKQLT